MFCGIILQLERGYGVLRRRLGQVLNGGKTVEKERKIRLSIERFEKTLRAAKLLKDNELVQRAWIEPGEMVVTVVK